MPACRMSRIVGDANRDHAWKNMTQEARQIEILRPAVKELIRVEATKRIPELMRRAFAVATAAGRARSCSTCRRTSATASTISTRRISGSIPRR